MTLGSTPISFPRLQAIYGHVKHLSSKVSEKHTEGRGDPYMCQCLTIAAVESIRVPSMSKRNAEKAARSSGTLPSTEPISLEG